MNNILFRFKQTKKADFPKSEHFPFEKLDQLRLQVNGFNQQQCLKGNLEQSAQQEIIHSEYVGILGTLLNNRMLPQIEFCWNDSQEPNKYVLANGFHYEYISQLYNLGMLYYHIAVHTETLKEQIDNIRYSLWCLMQLKDFLVYINQETKEKFSDLSAVHISMLNNYIYAFGLDKLYDTFRNSCQSVEEKIYCFGILHEAIQNLEQACRNLLQSQTCNEKEIFPIIHDQLQKLFRYKILLSETKLFIDIAKHLESTAFKAPSIENHMGKALTYLKKARKSVDNYFLLYEEEVPQLQYMIESIQTLNEELQNKNSSLYKQPLAKEFEFQVLKPKSSFLKSKIPLKIQLLQSIDKIRKAVGGDLVFQLTEVIRTKNDQMQQNYLHVQGSVEHIYYLYKVQYMMDAYANSNQIGLTLAIQKKFAFLQDQGGWKGLKEKISKIKKIQEAPNQKIKNIRYLIQQYQTIQVPEGEGVWLKYKNIEQFKRMVEQMEEQLQEAKAINEKILEQVDQAKDQIHFIEQNHNTIIASKLTSSQKYYQDNINKLKHLVLIVENTKNQFLVTKTKLFDVDVFIDSLKLGELNQIEQNRFQTINEQFEKFSQEINQIISTINIAKLEDLAKELYQNVKIITIANQSERQFEEKLKVIVDSFQNLIYAEMFYDSIFQQIEAVENEIINLQKVGR